MEDPIHILHLEDNPVDAELVQARLAEAGLVCRIIRVWTRDEFNTALGQCHLEIILADFKLPSYDGMSALQLVHRRCPEIPFIFVSGTMGEEVAIEALTKGATDYVLKNNLSRLASAVQRALNEAQNLREHRQAEESIRKFSQVIKQSPVSIIITDAAGSIEFVNSKFTQATGYASTDVLGRNPRILQSGETAVETYRQLWQTVGSGGVWRGEFRNRKKNGELFWEEATIAPVRNAEGAITHYVAVKEDITERKQLENQLHQAQKIEAIGQLAGGVAHDYNNMLGVIMGHCEMAPGKPALDESLRDHLEQILAAGHRSAQITRQLLAFARKQAIACRVLDLNETMEGMLKLLRRLIGESIDLAWLPGAKLWPVKMDPSQVDQILANLCVNAKDAIQGMGKITIETHAVVFDDEYCAEHRGFSPGEYIMLVVSDNGSGMDRSTMDRIFEPFFTTKEVGRGTGLGLATVYGIVNQNAGFINVYSELGSNWGMARPSRSICPDMQAWTTKHLRPTWNPRS